MIKINTDKKIVDVLLDRASEILGVKVEGNNCREVYEFLKKGYNLIATEQYDYENAMYYFTDGSDLNFDAHFRTDALKKEFVKLDKYFEEEELDDLDETIEHNQIDPSYTVLLNPSKQYGEKDFLDYINMVADFSKEHKERTEVTTFSYGNEFIVKIDENGNKDIYIEQIFCDNNYYTYMDITLFFERVRNQTFDEVNKFRFDVFYKDKEEYGLYSKINKGCIDMDYEEFCASHKIEHDDITLLKQELFKAQINNDEKLHNVDYAISMIEKAPILICWFGDDIKYDMRVYKRLLDVSKDMYEEFAVSHNNMVKEIEEKGGEAYPGYYPLTNIAYGIMDSYGVIDELFPMYLADYYDIEKLKTYPEMYEMAKESIYMFNVMDDDEFDDLEECTEEDFKKAIDSSTEEYLKRKENN